MDRIYIIIFFLVTLLPINVFSQNETGVPRDGEGIHAFLRRYKWTDAGDYKQFLELNKGKFGKNNSLLKGRTYVLPSASIKKEDEKIEKKNPDKSTTEKDKTAKGVKKVNKLFGKKYQEYTVKSNRLKGAVFYLSSGHGGPDCGAIGKANGKELHEDEYAYDITLRLARALLEEGATVHMIIQDAKDGIRDEAYLKNSRTETCMGAAIPRNQLRRLKQRTDKINSLSRKDKEKYKRAVFIHLDSRSEKQKLDVFFYYSKNSKDGKKLANTMRETFSSHYDKHQPSRGFTGTVSPRSLYVLNNSTPVGIFAELGNIRNSFDQRRFIQYDNRHALANWMCRGFIKDYENWKKK